MDLDQAKSHFDGHIVALNRMVPHENPWVFVCGAVVIEYLASLAAGQKAGAKGYKDFVRDYMPDGYKEFKYRTGATDLPIQIYHVLRCGLVHSFSFIPDPQARTKGGRDSSVVISHDATDGHLTSYGTGTMDACCLLADRFVADIESAMNKLFTKAKSDAVLENKILAWLRAAPPIKALPT